MPVIPVADALIRTLINWLQYIIRVKKKKFATMISTSVNSSNINDTMKQMLLLRELCGYIRYNVTWKVS